MNLAEAKQISMPELLSTLGHEPVKRRSNHELWYLSPLRQERTASFKVDTLSNRWYDFGEAASGDVVDFVCQFYRLSSIREALARLASLPQVPQRRVARPEPITRSSPLKIEQIEPLRSKVLVEYLRQRGISITIAQKYLREVHYQCRGRRYFALGFENDAGGYELRNPKFKGSTSKNISTIAGTEEYLWIFEGFADFLSAAEMFDDKLIGTIIVLNSTSNLGRAISVIGDLDPIRIELYRDADEAGHRVLEQLQAALPKPTIVDWAPLYANDGHNDLNEWHVANHSDEALKYQARKAV